MKTVYAIEIEITAKDEGGYEISLDEVIKKLNEGYAQGGDSNDDESYYFNVSKSDISED